MGKCNKVRLLITRLRECATLRSSRFTFCGATKCSRTASASPRSRRLFPRSQTQFSPPPESGFAVCPYGPQIYAPDLGHGLSRYRFGANTHRSDETGLTKPFCIADSLLSSMKEELNRLF